MKLIDKSALVAEIERLKEIYSKCPTRNNYEDGLKEGRRIGYEDVLHKINTLEVKDVDLEKELIEWHKKHFKKDGTFIGMSGFYLTNNSQTDIARHFFELGLSVNNPITAADRCIAEEIIINLKRVEQDYRIDLTKEIEWLRNQVKKGE